MSSPMRVVGIESEHPHLEPVRELIGHLYPQLRIATRSMRC